MNMINADNILMNSSISSQPLNNGSNLFHVKGNINIQSGMNTGNLYLQYKAASPANFRQSFSGSGLPYPNEKVAFDNSPNRGIVALQGNSYSFHILFPNSYYSKLGTVYNPPQVKIALISPIVLNNGTRHLQIKNKQTIPLHNPIPYRSLAYAAPNLTIPRTTGCHIRVPRHICKSPFFYTNFYRQQPNPIRSQQQILWDSKFPTKMKWYPNFWGDKPPK